jgi:DNA-binding winged helix-turn-helix (wHTH) protein
MVRGGDDDAVNLLVHLVEHLAEVVERGDIGNPVRPANCSIP